MTFFYQCQLNSTEVELVWQSLALRFCLEHVENKLELEEILLSLLNNSHSCHVYISSLIIIPFFVFFFFIILFKVHHLQHTVWHQFNEEIRQKSGAGLFQSPMPDICLKCLWRAVPAPLIKYTTILKHPYAQETVESAASSIKTLVASRSKATIVD